MNIESCVVTCLQCKGKSRIKIFNDREVEYIDHTPIIACRKRPDMIWGFECICGNDSRVAPAEKENLKVLVQGAAHSIKNIADGLKIKHELKFKMEPA